MKNYKTKTKENKMESIKFRVWDSFLKKYIDKEETDINTGDPLIIYQFIDTSYNEKKCCSFYYQTRNRTRR